MNNLAKIMGYEKRVKYGEKVVNLLKNKKYRGSARKNELPDIGESDKKISKTKVVKGFRDINKHSTGNRSHKGDLSRSMREKSPEKEQEER